jgi:hypothetical protein
MPKYFTTCVASKILSLASGVCTSNWEKEPLLHRSW